MNNDNENNIFTAYKLKNNAIIIKDIINDLILGNSLRKDYKGLELRPWL